MTEEAASAWQDLCSAFDELLSRLNKVASVNVNSGSLRGATREVAQQYFRQVRRLLARFELGEHIAELDTAFQNLMKLTAGRNAASSYRKHAKAIRRVLPKVTGLIELQLSGAMLGEFGPTQQDTKIIDTLARLAPSAANSYRQAMADLGDTKRVSFKGPAHELRETLREVLDHSAPDAEVQQSDGFKPEEGQTKPTMKQKVRFILKARGLSKKGSAAPEDTVAAVEAMLVDLTRTVYDAGAAAAHVAQERNRVVKLKRYIDVVLQELLEL
jgi:hypothetical protein